MNMSANGVNSANTQLMNNYNNTAAQKAQQAGAFLGRLVLLVVKYLRWFKCSKVNAFHKQLALGKMASLQKQPINSIVDNSYTKIKYANWWNTRWVKS